MPLLRYVKGGVDNKAWRDRFYQDGSWWAFPPNSVLPVKIHDVIDLGKEVQQLILTNFEVETNKNKIDFDGDYLSLPTSLLP